MTKVYVSATFLDLQDCRAAVKLALSRLRVEDLSMESYVAEDRRPVDKCLSDVADCDIYIGIFAWRYGHIPPGYDKSITELEYRKAVADRKPCLIFLLDEDAPWPRARIDRGVDADRVEALRAELSVRHTCGTFTESVDLAAQVTAAVANQLAENCWTEPAGPTLSPDIRTRYFTRLRQHYGALDLDALTPADREDYLRIELASVFVEQDVVEEPPPAELSRDWLRRMQADGHLDTEEAPEHVDPAEWEQLRRSYQGRPPRPLFDLLGAPDQRTVVLLGDPGSGKSTVARYLTLALTCGNPGDRLSVLDDSLPLLIELRSYATLVAEGRCEGFLDYLHRRATADGLGVDRVSLQRHLAAGGRALVIFDGLDEVFDPRRREEVASEIACFAADFPLVRVLVTARIVGYSRRILTDAGFTHATLHDLDEPQIDEFLGSWYRLAMRGRPADAELRRGRLLEAMRHSHEIRELAGNPLLLTILAIIGKHQALPRERWRLYAHAATVLVEHWDVNRHLRDQHDVPHFLATDDKLELLRRLAFRMQSTERGLPANHIAGEELRETFARYLIERYQRDPAAARSISLRMIDQFRERNFILSRYGPDVYGFVHRTFLEYFCADAIVSRFQHDQVMSLDELTEVYRSHWADPSWREVLRLVAGALHERHTATLIRLLAEEVNRPWPPSAFNPSPVNLALAVQCLAEVRNLAAVAGPAEALLRQVILLLEHSVPINDAETMRMVEDDVLPAVSAIGTAWPGRDSYLAWYRRRGVRLIWSPVSALAARIAAMLAAPADRIDELFDMVLGGTDDSAAAYASIAGLAEVARIATAPTTGPRQAAANGPHQAATARVRQLLVRRVRDDQHAGVRLAAVQALGQHFPDDLLVCDVLIEQARADRYAGVRVAAVQALGEGFRDTAQIRDVLRERARDDQHPGVRRTAVHQLGDRPDSAHLPDVVLDALRTDPDPDVVRAAARALFERYGADERVRDVLIQRSGDEDLPLVRRAAVQLLGARLAGDDEVRAVLFDRVRHDGDAGVLRAAAGACVDLSRAGDRVRSALTRRARDDHDEIIRQAALRALLEHLPREDVPIELLTALSRRDPDADVRLVATGPLADLAGTEPAVRPTLRELTRGDADPRVRLLAVRSLIERVGVESIVRDVLAGVARDDPAAALRSTAVEALADCVDTGPGIRALLIGCAHADHDPSVRLAAVRAITGKGDLPEDVLTELLDRTHRDADADVFTLAATTVTELQGPTPRSYRLLEARLRDDSNARVRLAAIQLLVDRFGADVEVRAVLLQLVRHDPDAEVVRTAGDVLADHIGEDAELSAALVARATGDAPVIRSAAARTLCDRFAADPRIRALLVAIATGDEDVQVRRDVLRAAGEQLADSTEARELLGNGLRDPDWSVRVAAVHAVTSGFGGEEQTRTLLTRLARGDRDPQFRRVVCQALTWLPDADPDLLPSLDG